MRATHDVIACLHRTELCPLLSSEKNLWKQINLLQLNLTKCGYVPLHDRSSQDTFATSVRVTQPFMTVS